MAAPPPNRWWIVPAVLIGLVVVAWLVLAGLPFGGDRREVSRQEPRTVDTVTEAPAPAPSATILEVPAPAATRTVEPQTVEPPRKAEPRIAKTTAPRPQPAVTPAKQTPAAATRTEREEITAAEAEAALRGHLSSTNYYSISADCTRLNSRGYENVGYTFEVWDRCDPGGGSRMLGRWRIDAKTREIFRQRDDGRYLRP